MRHSHLARRAGVPTAVVVFGLLLGGPARADVTVSPTSAVQGSGQNLTLNVTNTGSRPIGTITVRLPADTPIAEVYPLSVDDWAPRIEPRTLSTPLDTIHGGTPVTQTAGAITWIAMPGKALAPGRSANVAMAVGPLPTVGSMSLAVQTRYADGKPGPAMPPATLTLTAAQPGQAPPAHHGAAPAGGDASEAEGRMFANAVAEAERGTPIWSIGGWVVAGLLLLGGAALVLRGRHRRTDEDDEPDDDEKPDETQAHDPQAHDRTASDEQAPDQPAAATVPKEPVAAGRSKWSYPG